MKITIEAYTEYECYQLIDQDSDQSHDGDNSKELIADVFDVKNAVLIASFLNNIEKFINNETIKKSCLEIVKKLPTLKKENMNKETEWKLKENKDGEMSMDFWYDLTLGGGIVPENILLDKEQIKKLNEAIAIVSSFEIALAKEGYLED